MNFALDGGRLVISVPARRIRLAGGTPSLTWSPAGDRPGTGPSGWRGRQRTRTTRPHLVETARTPTTVTYESTSEQSIRIVVDVALHKDGTTRIRSQVHNTGESPVTLQRLSVMRFTGVTVGLEPRSWRIFRNGYQSWSGTSTIGVSERDVDVPSKLARVATTDGRHRAETGQGHVRSDSISAIVEPHSGDALGMGFTMLADAYSFIELDAPDGIVNALDLWVDLDDITLGAGDSTGWFEVLLHTATDGYHALRTVAVETGQAMGARATDATKDRRPNGWCSWYYYFTNVSEADVDTNLAVLRADGPAGPEFGADYVMIDDGHQTEIGDWLSTNEKFPSGMGAVAGRIHEAGFEAGLWWAPFIASSRSTVVKQHPEWVLRTGRGTPVIALVNPGWGLTNRLYALDTTHPEVLDHIENVARTIGRMWGYEIQKIDFLYAASLEGRRFDPTVTRARALRMGLDAVRRGTGDDGFILACGCPLGPAVGVADAMRIGADVTPSWDSLIARTVGRNRHALSTANALLNTVTRSFLDRAWFLNDPDCLMVRDTNTTLTAGEVQLMCTVFGMTNGMVVLSDRLDELPTGRRALVARTRELLGGEVNVDDLFERRPPERMTSVHTDHVDVALINLGTTAYRGTVDVADLLARTTPDRSDSTVTAVEYWSGRKIDIERGDADLGMIAPHSAQVLRIALP